ncbi:Helicase and polymerase-containing protein TEBICHI, partial [Diplonema papillatum]
VAAFEAFSQAMDCEVVSFAGLDSGRLPDRGRCFVAICTIEKANALVNTLLADGREGELRCFVVDELHMVGEEGRGPVLEAMLTKMMLRAPRCQIVGMSATLPNLPELAAWLDAELYSSDFRPVVLKQYLRVGGGPGKVKGKASLVDDKGCFVREIPSPPDDREGVALLVNEVVPDHGCLVFCPSKTACGGTAKWLAERLGQRAKDAKKAQRAMLLRELAAASSHGAAGPDAALQTVLAGVACHHAGLMAEERKLIEAAYRNRVLCVVCCTSTLAAGVNLPARRVVIKNPYTGPVFLTKSRYLQMSGRAGRAGLDTLGESFLVCSDKDTQRCLQLMKRPVEALESKLLVDEAMERAVLDCLTTQTATTVAGLKRFLTRSLLNVFELKKSPPPPPPSPPPEKTEKPADEQPEAGERAADPKATGSEESAPAARPKALRQEEQATGRPDFPDEVEEQLREVEEMVAAWAGVLDVQTPGGRANPAPTAATDAAGGALGATGRDQTVATAGASRPGLQQNLPANPGLQQNLPANPGLQQNLPANPGLQQNLPANPGLQQNLPANPGLQQNLPANPGLQQNLPANPGLQQNLPANPGLQQNLPANPGLQQNLPANPGLQQNPPADDPAGDVGVKKERPQTAPPGGGGAGPGSCLLAESAWRLAAAILKKLADGRFLRVGRPGGEGADDAEAASIEDLLEDGASVLQCTTFGATAFKSGFTSSEATRLRREFRELQENGLVLADDLHMLYHLTPVKSVWGWRLDWERFGKILSGLPPLKRRIAGMVGVSEPFVLQKSAFLSVGQNTASFDEYTCRRFYLALTLTELLNEVPVPDVAAKYGVEKGWLQNVQINSALFCNMMVGFTESMAWSSLQVTMQSYVKRIGCGVRADCAHLTEIPGVQAGRARCLWNAGFKDIGKIAKADPAVLAAKVQQISTRPGKANQAAKFFGQGVAVRVVAAAKVLLAQKVEEKRKELEILEESNAGP